MAVLTPAGVVWFALRSRADRRGDPTSTALVAAKPHDVAARRASYLLTRSRRECGRFPRAEERGEDVGRRFGELDAHDDRVTHTVAAPRDPAAAPHVADAQLDELARGDVDLR